MGLWLGNNWNLPKYEEIFAQHSSAALVKKKIVAKSEKLMTVKI